MPKMNLSIIQELKQERYVMGLEKKMPNLFLDILLSVGLAPQEFPYTNLTNTVEMHSCLKSIGRRKAEILRKATGKLLQ